VVPRGAIIAQHQAIAGLPSNTERNSIKRYAAALAGGCKHHKYCGRAFRH
jgi:hypothetical protein